MKRKTRLQTGIDNRQVVLYARKSRITNKGDSIGVQFKQSADYAVNQLSLPEDYEFAKYEDKGLSGYYSDRPDFQRLLRDIEMGKIKAVACYKLDRISRKTSDLMRLLEYFERHDVTLLVCSNNINTQISTSKIIIQVLAIIAEFERDTLTERIQDNLMELAKDGRWLGGKTPTGFSSERVTTGSGKNKSAVSFLVTVLQEKMLVQEIYSTFWELRSLLQTTTAINKKYETKHGSKSTTSTIRLILRNPIYCVADEFSYNYFLEKGGNLFGDISEFDGQHGLSSYNKTDQMKVEDEDSTFFNPKFSQLMTQKPISEWIISVGRHEGFIPSRKWVETQKMLDEIAEKYNRPHRKTNALLSGLMYCPICGKRLRVLPESNRWTNGKPRFKYACPGVREKKCDFKAAEGVSLDEFVVQELSKLSDEQNNLYRKIFESRIANMIRTEQSEQEYQETKKAVERLNTDIAAHYGKRSCIIGWQIDNELNCEINEYYSESDNYAFREFLKNKYGTLGELNRAWGAAFWNQTYTEWEQVFVPRTTINNLTNPHQMLDFKRFISESTIRWCKLQSDILRKYVKPGDFITTNSVFSNVDKHRMYNDCLDIHAYDCYPNSAYSIDLPLGGPASLNDRKWSMNLTNVRSICPHFGIMEQQVSAGGWNSLIKLPTPNPGQLMLWAMNSVAHGADSISFFRWRTCPFGTEMYYHGILDTDNLDTKRLGEVKQFSERLSRISETVGADYVAPFAIVRDYENIFDAQVDTWHKVISDNSEAAVYQAAPPVYMDWNGQRLETGSLNDILKINGPDATLLATYCDNYYSGEPALVETSFGKGKIVHFGGVFTRENTKAFLAYTGILSPFNSLVELPDTCEIAIREKAGNQYLFVLNFDAKPQTITLHKNVRDFDDNRELTGNVTLPAYGTKVYRVCEC